MLFNNYITCTLLVTFPGTSVNPIFLQRNDVLLQSHLIGYPCKTNVNKYIRSQLKSMIFLEFKLCEKAIYNEVYILFICIAL